MTGIFPKKHLSQHFLRNTDVCRRIVDSISVQPHDWVLEIGPGEGVLTEYLLQTQAERIMAVEIDERCVTHLRSRWDEDPRFKLIHADFLSLDIQNLTPKGIRWRLVGNLPYAITSPILFQALENKTHVRDMTIMVQKEVAERLAASPNCKAYGIPSVLFQLMADVELLFPVSAEDFYPPPKVTSAVLKITFLDKPRYIVNHPARFSTLVKVAFNQRRKMLRRSIKQLLPENCTGCPVDLALRPEQLSVEAFVALCNWLNPSSST